MDELRDSCLDSMGQDESIDLASAIDDALAPISTMQPGSSTEPEVQLHRQLPFPYILIELFCICFPVT
ncbi:hypothetical protein DFR68_113105 [Nocardia mexicana]|uniref:Uncharacterized protein n=1 Tax=Nocardia mexicana TaxID=279262 RepID=A0A370GS54_9NOCA|nr:hypothetical protein DFR68_113105 [Nocardia mexicana]